MWIGLTGTPGTGKTATADYLRTKDIDVIDLTAYAKTSGCITGRDPERDTSIVDVDCLTKTLVHDFDHDQTVFFEGLFAHLLPVTYVIILRCHPNTLRKRLKNKKYKSSKIKENVDAETLDIILCEAAELHPDTNLYEIDTTTKTPQQTGDIIIGLLSSNFPTQTNYKIGAIDWSEEILREEHDSR